MTIKRTWRVATAGLAAATLLTMSAGVAVAQLEPITDPLEDLIGGDDEDGDDAETTEASSELGPGGFAGCAAATGLQVRVGLPEEFEPLNQLLEPLGLGTPTGAFGAFCPTDFSDNGTGIYLDLARTQAELARAAEGEDATPLAQALATNLVLENAPCTGLGSAALPDEDTPVLRIELADVSCEESGEQALAHAKVAGVFLNAGTMLELMGAEALTDAFQQLVDGLNESLFGPVNDGVAQLCAELVDGGIGDLPALDLDQPLEDCQDSLEINLENFLGPEIPLIELDVLESNSEVTFDDGVVTAEASAELAGLALLGLVCVEGSEPGAPLEYTSVATSDGVVATAETSSTNATTRLCGNAALLEVIALDGLFGSVELLGVPLSDILGEEIQALEDGIEEALRTFGISVAAARDADVEEVDGAAALASTPPFVIANVAPFSAIEQFEDTPLAALSVSVAGLETFAAVNAVPAGITPPAPPEEEDDEPDPTPVRQLPRTGTAAGLAALATLGLAGALRRTNG